MTSDSSSDSGSRPQTSDFASALKAKLARNAELAEERARAEEEMDRLERERREAEQRRKAELSEEQYRRHGVLVECLSAAAQGLKQAEPESFVVRLGWTESRQEFIAKISTRLLQPARSLLIELDRDDDEVLARWHSDLGNALELWRLLEAPPELMEELVLQVADQALWRGLSRPPRFPRGDKGRVPSA